MRLIFCLAGLLAVAMSGAGPGAVRAFGGSQLRTGGQAGGSEAGAVVLGQVVDTEGKPVGGVVVALSAGPGTTQSPAGPMRNGAGPRLVLADAYGQFAFLGV